MSNGYIALPKDSNGKKLRTRTVTEGSEVHDEVVRLSNQSDVLVNPATEETLLAVKTAVENIDIDADTINLNTDQLESKLDTLNSKDFATQTTLALIKAKTDNLDTALSGILTELQQKTETTDIQSIKIDQTTPGTTNGVQVNAALPSGTNAIGSVKLVDSDGVELKADGATRAFPTIDHPHHEIHEGDAFDYCEVTDLGNGATRDLLIVTPNTAKWAHMVIDVTSESEMDMIFYEGTTTSNDGTAVTEVNRNRNSATTATTVITHTPTVSTTGTMLCQRHWGSGRASGGTSRNLNEWVLKQNTKYLVRITNATTSNNQCSAELNWYEHTNI